MDTKKPEAHADFRCRNVKRDGVVRPPRFWGLQLFDILVAAYEQLVGDKAART